MFNGVCDGKGLGEVLAECDKDAMAEAFSGLSSEEKKAFFDKMRDENIFE